MQQISFKETNKIDFSKNMTSKNKILITIPRFLENPTETEISWKKKMFLKAKPQLQPNGNFIKNVCNP